MKTLFISDLDGTLLGRDSRVSQRSVDLLNDAIRRGAMFTVATARTPATADGLLSRVDISLPMIVMTGAAFWNKKTQAYFDPVVFPDDQLEKAMAILAEGGIRPFVYTLQPGSPVLHTFHEPPLGRHDLNFADQRRGLPLKRFHFHAPDPAQMRSATLLLLAMGERGLIDRTAQELRASTGCTVSAYPDIFNPKVGILEVFAPGVSKASAIRKLARQTGADRTVVFGDNLNDIDMMRAADVAIAVDNALPEVKEAATEVIGPNYADSVAETIARLTGA